MKKCTSPSTKAQYKYYVNTLLERCNYYYWAEMRKVLNFFLGRKISWEIVPWVSGVEWRATTVNVDCDVMGFGMLSDEAIVIVHSYVHFLFL